MTEHYAPRREYASADDVENGGGIPVDADRDTRAVVRWFDASREAASGEAGARAQAAQRVARLLPPWEIDGDGDAASEVAA